jgi:hypothetical protein
MNANSEQGHVCKVELLYPFFGIERSNLLFAWEDNDHDDDDEYVLTWDDKLVY